MKDKIKARYEAIKNDPYQRGMLVGGALGITAAVSAGIMFRVNLDCKGLYIPDEVIDTMRVSGYAIGIKNGTRVVLAIAPLVE